jgi:rhodanese-related sulfurtransferase
MFYRVVSSAAPGPSLTNVSASAALTLVTNRQDEPNFAIIDVRTSSEFQPRHIKGAVNLDFYAATFQTSLRALDTSRTYLVYCASGNRSRQATQVMQNLGFTRIYNMTQGFPTFAALPGAGPYLKP